MPKGGQSMDASRMSREEIKLIFVKINSMPDSTEFERKLKEACLQYFTTQCEELGYVRPDKSNGSSGSFK